MYVLICPVGELVCIANGHNAPVKDVSWITTNAGVCNVLLMYMYISITSNAIHLLTPD